MRITKKDILDSVSQCYDRTIKAIEEDMCNPGISPEEFRRLKNDKYIITACYNALLKRYFKVVKND